MKKPRKVQGEFIPRTINKTAQHSRYKKKSQEIDINNILGRLESSQIKEIAESVIELVNNGLEFGKEYLKTVQTLKNCEMEIEKSRNEYLKVREEETTKRANIEKDVKNNQHHFSLCMKKESDNHEQIMTILGYLEQGKISSSQLESLIYAVKVGGN